MIKRQPVALHNLRRVAKRPPRRRVVHKKRPVSLRNAGIPRLRSASRMQRRRRRHGSPPAIIINHHKLKLPAEPMPVKNRPVNIHPRIARAPPQYANRQNPLRSRRRIRRQRHGEKTRGNPPLPSQSLRVFGKTLMKRRSVRIQLLKPNRQRLRQSGKRNRRRAQNNRALSPSAKSAGRKRQKRPARKQRKKKERRKIAERRRKIRLAIRRNKVSGGGDRRNRSRRREPEQTAP